VKIRDKVGSGRKCGQGRGSLREFAIPLGPIRAGEVAG